MAQSARLLNFEESYLYLGSQKTKLYTELNTDLKIDDRIFIIGGNFDNYTLGIGGGNPYALHAIGYKILAIDTSQNWIVIDRDYDGTSVLASPSEEAFLSRGHFRKGQFNAGSFNDGVFGNNITPGEALFNHKKDGSGDHIPDAFINHCIWLNGVFHEGDWFSKTDNYNGFTSTKATLNESTNTVTIDVLTGGDANNERYGYNIWVDGTFENGHWRNGTWEAGTWENGEWDFGIFKSGDWLDGLKHFGVHTSINGRTTWYGGTHENGIMIDSFFEDGIWENGIWEGASNFPIASIVEPITAPYVPPGPVSFFAVYLSNTEDLSMFQVGEDILLSYVSVSSSYDNIWNSTPYIIQDITAANEIILVGTYPVSADLSLARISNSRFRHGVWQDGTWSSGYRRAGVEIDSSTIDDSLAGILVLEIIDPISWTDSIVNGDYGLVIGEDVLLTNITDSGGNDSENYTLTVNGIVPGNPTTIELIGAPASWQLDTIIKESAEGSYVDNTVWETGNFNGGTWENGYFKRGSISATTDTYLTHWRQGQWALDKWTDTLGLHGTWNNGVWEKGLFKNGEWHDGEWRTGTWESDFEFFPVTGDNYSAHWRTGTWKNGTWVLGQWDNGTWELGQWNHGVIPFVDNGLNFGFPVIELIDGIEYLSFRFEGLTPFTIEPQVGEHITIDNITDLFFAPVVLLDSFAVPIAGTTYEVINVFQDIGNSWTYVTVDSPQSFPPTIISQYLGDVTLEQDSKNVFEDGVFNGGVWDNGVFNNGVFQNIGSTWNDGRFNFGVFDNSTWNDGRFYDGTIQNSTWNQGRFYGGSFFTGTWNLGQFYGGQMQGSTWNAGAFYDGLMTTSTINNGDFYGGEVNNSTMNSGNLRDGNLFKDSTMNGGTLNGAVFESSIKNAGLVVDGFVRGDSFHNGGTFSAGDWEEGTWNDGTWSTAIFEANNFTYDAPGGGTTTVNLFETDNIDIITNGEFLFPVAEWTADAEWSLGGGLASVVVAGAVPAGTINTNLTQLAISSLNTGFTYRVSFDVIENSHPYTGIAIAPRNLLYIDVGTATVLVPDTTVGPKTVTIVVTGPGGPLDFTIRAQILKAAAIAQTIRIDNVVVDRVVSNISGFGIGAEMWQSGLGYKFFVPDALVPLNQKGVVSSISNGLVSIDFIGDLIIEKNNPTQERLYASRGIWRNGTLIEGAMTGMLFKSGNLIKPNMITCVVENGNANYEVDTKLINIGLDFQTITGWTLDPSWTIASGSAICVPEDNTTQEIVQAGILSASEWYIVSLKVGSNSNFLEEYINVKLGTNVYYLGAGQVDKTYSLLCRSDGTDFAIEVTSKQFSLIQSSVKLTNLKIEKVNITEFDSSTWLDGTADGIYLENSQWIDGTMQSGILLNSIWEEGTCEFANFYDSVWKGGEWKDGVFDATEAYNAKWENGTWENGLFFNGEWLCGIWEGGIWNKGMFRDGAMRGITKFYSGAVEFGNIDIRTYPKKLFLVVNIANDQDGDTVEIKADTGESFMLMTAKDTLAAPESNEYPSGIFNPTTWGTYEQPWTVNFRANADWAIDSQKVIMRDVLDYHLNNESSYSDTWDVDYIDGSSIVSADLSGDGMTDSANNQSSVFIKFVRKQYIEQGLIKAGSSIGFSPAGGTILGRNTIHWMGGSHIGGTTSTKLVDPYFNYTANIGGFARLHFGDDLTGQISGGDKIYMYGLGEYDGDAANLSNKDGFYNVTSAFYNGGSGFYEVTTTRPITGSAPMFTLNQTVELWVDVIKTDTVINTTTVDIRKVGRYFAYTLNGDHSAIIKKDSEIMFQSILSSTVLNYIRNGKNYTVKSVRIEGGTKTVVILDIKISNNLATTPVVDTVNATVITPPTGSSDFCLGGGGPGGGPGPLPPTP